MITTMIIMLFSYVMALAPPNQGRACEMQSMLSKQPVGPQINQYPMLSEQQICPPEECGGYGQKRNTRQEMMAYIKCYAEAMNNVKKGNPPPQKQIQVVTVTMDRTTKPSPNTERRIPPKANKRRKEEESSDERPKKKKERKEEESSDEKPKKKRKKEEESSDEKPKKKKKKECEDKKEAECEDKKKKHKPVEEPCSTETCQKPSTQIEKEVERYVTVTRHIYKTVTAEKPLTLYREITKTVVKEKPIINYKITTVTETITERPRSKAVEPTVRPPSKKKETIRRKKPRFESAVSTDKDYDSASTDKDYESDSGEAKPKRLKCAFHKIPRRGCKAPEVKKPMVRGCEMVPGTEGGKIKMVCRLASPLPMNGGKKRGRRRPCEKKKSDITDLEDVKIS